MEREASITFSPFQRRAIAAGITALALLVVAAFGYALFRALQMFVVTFANVIWPLAVAGILALLLRPLVLFVERRFQVTRFWSVAIIYLSAIVVVGIAVAFILPILITQVGQLIESFPVFLENVRAFIERNSPIVYERVQQFIMDDSLAEVRTKILETAQQIGPNALPALMKAGNWIMGVLTIGTLLAIIPIYLFFFLISRAHAGKSLEDELSFIPEKYREDIIFLAEEFVGSLVAFFRGQILVGLITGILLSIGFTIIGLNFSVFFGLLFGALNIIPYLGTIVGMTAALPTAYFQPDGGLTLGLLVIAVFVIVQSLESYLIAPKVMGRETGLHPMTIIIAVFFWGIALDGILGMVLAVPLTAFFIVAWRLLRRKYLRSDLVSTTPAPSEG